MPSEQDFAQKCGAGDHETWDPFVQGGHLDKWLWNSTHFCALVNKIVEKFYFYGNGMEWICLTIEELLPFPCCVLLPRFERANFLIRKLKQNMGDCWQGGRIIKHQEGERFKDATRHIWTSWGWSWGGGNICKAFWNMSKLEGPLANSSNLKRSNRFQNVIFLTSHWGEQIPDNSPNPATAMSHNFVSYNTMY